MEMKKVELLLGMEAAIVDALRNLTKMEREALLCALIDDVAGMNGADSVEMMVKLLPVIKEINDTFGNVAI